MVVVARRDVERRVVVSTFERISTWGGGVLGLESRRLPGRGGEDPQGRARTGLERPQRVVVHTPAAWCARVWHTSHFHTLSASTPAADPTALFTEASSTSFFVLPAKPSEALTYA